MYQGCRAPKYDLTNIGANIRRIQKRILELTTREEEESLPDIERDEYTVEYSKDHNRVRFLFAQRPSKAVCSIMKENGYRWSRREEAWQRQLTEAGIASAQRVIELLSLAVSLRA